MVTMAKVKTVVPGFQVASEGLVGVCQRHVRVEAPIHDVAVHADQVRGPVGSWTKESLEGRVRLLTWCTW